MSKKWGYKAGESRIFDVKEACDLPEGWSPSPATEDGADKEKGAGDPLAPATEDGADKVSPSKSVKRRK